MPKELQQFVPYLPWVMAGVIGLLVYQNYKKQPIYAVVAAGSVYFVVTYILGQIGGRGGVRTPNLPELDQLQVYIPLAAILIGGYVGYAYGKKQLLWTLAGAIGGFAATGLLGLNTRSLHLVSLPPLYMALRLIADFFEFLATLFR